MRAPANRRAELIGVTLSAAVGGSLLGPVLGTAATQTSPKLVFLLVAGLGALLLAWTLTERAPQSGGASDFGAFIPALRNRPVLTGMWLTVLSALMYGTLAVLAPLRLSHLGAGNLTIGAVFLLGAAAAGVASPLVGRMSDRRGWRIPVLAGLAASMVCVALLPLPRSVPVLFALVLVADPLFGVAYPPAGALISDGAEEIGLDQGYAFGLFNLAWAVGQVIGGAGSAGMAQLSSDAVPYGLLAALCLATVLAVRALSARPAASTRSR
jgi:MFS family permease